ncbi:MAG: HyaD/HybD family hydrogenase maturation endopeptidase [Gemmatimonadota bacterium]|nr:MAG: HyaD/HybD family hydrogenase maturation endopeptidase [Gemmatimonadota bacterium]
MSVAEPPWEAGAAGRSAARHETVVIGVGNPLMGDDGVGLAALDRLRAWDFEPFVERVDGGTWGMNLLQFVEEARRLVILDAIQAGREPGALVTLEGDEIPRFLSTKLSPHQIELREVLALAELRGTLPEETVALGLQPARVEMSDRLSPEVEASLDAVVDACVERLRSWGHRARPRASVEGRPGEGLPPASGPGATPDRGTAPGPRRPLPW